MGYTHYFEARTDDERWAPLLARFCVEDLPRITAAAGVDLAGYDEVAGIYTPDAPVATEGGIALNGHGTDVDGEDLSHETLVLEPDPLGKARAIVADPALGEHDKQWYRYLLERAAEHDGRHWECVKTARKPYDLVVAAVLLRLAERADDPDLFRVDSDGTWDHEWLHGALYWDSICCEPGIGARTLYATVFGTTPACPWIGVTA